MFDPCDTCQILSLFRAERGKGRCERSIREQAERRGDSTSRSYRAVESFSGGQARPAPCSGGRLSKTCPEPRRGKAPLAPLSEISCSH